MATLGKGREGKGYNILYLRGAQVRVCFFIFIIFFIVWCFIVECSLKYHPHAHVPFFLRTRIILICKRLKKT